MRSPYRRPAAIARLAGATLAALTIATPASAQFGGLKKKVKPAANQEGAAPGGQGGMIVLTDDVVKQLLTGLKAGQVEREAAAREDTPYGRYQKAEAAYAVAQPKCEAAQQTFPKRAAANQKMLDQYSALTDKMVAAQSKSDQKLTIIYQDSALAMQDPSCIVKQPKQPDDYYQAQRVIDTLVEGREAKAAGFTPNEFAMVKERAIAILHGASPPADASPAEKAAVSAKSAELRPLLGFRDQPVVEVTKTEAAPAPAPAPAPAAPQMSAAASSMSACMAKNMQSHQAEIEALGKHAQAAQAAKDTQKLMAIADTVQRIQMAGCQGR